MCERWSCTKNIEIDKPLRVAYHLAKNTENSRWQANGKVIFQKSQLIIDDDAFSLSLFPHLSLPASHETHLSLIWIQTITEMPNLGEPEKIARHYATGYPGFEIDFFLKGPTGD